ncbi:AAA family ATPase [Candidatus Binatus sp.]|uniref:AAA family ATPase n=1 Tax=Candidatus Binatus sp. TaxID=2811406 RepID=UPI003CC66C94
MLDCGACELRQRDVVVPLQRIPLELLCLLIDRRGQLVTREEILERVWGKGVFVDIENSINTAVRKVRQALCDNPEAPRFVATVPARGYRFIAEIRAPKKSRADQFRSRPPSTMVGRVRELASLSSGLDDATSRRGRLFLISGKPGVGKTRLADEAAAAADARRMAILAGHCSEHDEAVAYLPFVEILENFVDRASDPDSLRKALGEQASELVRLLPKLKHILPGLPPPLDLPPPQARRHLFNCFFDFAARIASEQPALMILEDLHWADDSTLSLLDHLVQRLADLPLMVIGTYRDAELNITRPLAKTLEDLHRGRLATSTRLKGLPRDEVAAMLNGLSGKSPPDAVVGEVFAETEGNPFFVEELFRYLEEENRLYDSAGQFRSDLKIGELDAPPSVRLVVARRLARHTDLTQKMLARAAVIGRFFTLQILQASSAADADSILECLEEAEKGELVYSVADGPGARFEFAHELTRQAVLSGLSAARRQRLHLEVAEAIERTYSTAPEYYGELAHHFRLGGDPVKAIDYLVRAAREAAARSAPQQSISLATTGLELLSAIPDQQRRDHYELLLQMILGSCGSLALGFAVPEVERAYTKALELVGRADQTPAAIRAMVGLYVYYSRGADYRRAATLQAQMLELVPTLAESRLRGIIHYSIGFRLMYMGEFEAARDQLEPAITCSAGHPRRVQARAALALTVWNLGYADRAWLLIKEAAAEVRELPDPYTQVMVADNALMISGLSKDIQNTRRYAEEIIEKSMPYGFIAEVGIATIMLAWADGLAGDPKAVDRLRESVAEFEAGEGDLGHSSFLARTAELCLKFGRNDEAVLLLEEAIDFIGQTGQGYAESEIYRLRGKAELQLGRSQFGSAAKWFERAIDAARKRSARIAELRATTNLARLLATQRKRDQARAMLAEIYDWFTEGFDSPDLKDAKSLLYELNS